MFRLALTRLQHALPTLSYPVEGGIPPVISGKQLDLHYNKHHNAYITKLNGFCASDAKLKSSSLEDIVKATASDPAKKAVFNNAAQHYNHSFYWSCLKPNGSNIPASLEAALKSNFGSVDEFKAKFEASALGNFGSGWTWLVQKPDGKLDIVNTSNAAVPITDGLRPLLTVDVWEHAYYVDFLNRRDSYLQSFWKIVNWDFVASNLK